MERLKQKAKRKARNVGLHSHMVKKHKKDGVVSSNSKNNVFISAGPIRNVHRPSLNKVYPGDFCEAALISQKTGDDRLLLCDCEGKLRHDLPDETWENDVQNWSRVMKLSRRAMKE